MPKAFLSTYLRPLLLPIHASCGCRLIAILTVNVTCLIAYSLERMIPDERLQLGHDTRMTAVGGSVGFRSRRIAVVTGPGRRDLSRLTGR